MNHDDRTKYSSVRVLGEQHARFGVVGFCPKCGAPVFAHATMENPAFQTAIYPTCSCREEFGLKIPEQENIGAERNDIEALIHQLIYFKEAYETMRDGLMGLVYELGGEASVSKMARELSLSMDADYDEEMNIILKVTLKEAAAEE